MRIIVLQHLGVEHPGVLRDFMREDGLHWTTVELDRGHRIPDLAAFDVMMVMGGPQDVWQEDVHPWLVDEKKAIRTFVMELRRPFLGICLGHQLLAEAIGGRVAPGDAPEVGVLAVSKTALGRADPLLAGVADPMTVVQWHGAEVKELPGAAAVLASSEACPVQAFRYGEVAYGLQFHVEITQSTVGEWAAVPEYASALERALGANAVDGLEREVAARLAGFNSDAKKIYENFKTLAGWSRT